jgi:hypothetical protein
MKKAVGYLILLVFTLSSLGCIPVAVGGLILKSSKTKAQQQQFLTELQKTNYEREKAGLAPLDICIAKYQFDEGWANNDEGCRKKIAAYKRGEIDECGRPIKKQ